METEFIYWRHHTLPGIKVEEICGGENRPMSLWREMAYRVYSENGREVYREIGHFRNGAPFLIGENGRISITHTGRFLAVATLPPTLKWICLSLRKGRLWVLMRSVQTGSRF